MNLEMVTTLVRAKQFIRKLENVKGRCIICDRPPLEPHRLDCELWHVLGAIDIALSDAPIDLLRRLV